MYFLAPGLIALGAVAYQRGWARRASRRTVYEQMLGQLNSARRKFAEEPNTTNRLNVDRCELNAMYEAQKGRARRRIGIILIFLGIVFALTHQ